MSAPYEKKEKVGPDRESTGDHFPFLLQRQVCEVDEAKAEGWIAC